MKKFQRDESTLSLILSALSTFQSEGGKRINSQELDPYSPSFN